MVTGCTERQVLLKAFQGCVRVYGRATRSLREVGRGKIPLELFLRHFGRVEDARRNAEKALTVLHRHRKHHGC